MSHFTKIRSTITDVACLKKALIDMGFHENHIEVHEQAQNLFGYQGDKRSQTAEVIIRRNNVGMASNDIGFKKADDGTFEAIISQFDKTRSVKSTEHTEGIRGYSEKWLNKLTQRYSLYKVKEELDASGFFYDVETIDEDGKIHLKAYNY